MNVPARHWVVVRLGTAQTLAWASSYYLPALLAQPMARDLGVGTSTIFAAFSLALVVSALLGPLAGHAIDRHGGRPVLLGTNLLFAAGLGALALAQGPVGLFAAWALIGIAMGSGLYEAAFATLVRLYGQGARGAITGITLVAGFASTVGWPLTAWMEATWDWRGACAGWAALHLLLGLPLQAAVAAAALVGPAQVAARLLEFGLLRRMHPQASARLAALAHPTGALLLAWAGGAGSVAFTLLHGAGNGILTIAKGTLPLVLFGSLGYGLRQGMLMVPARVAQAFAPLLFGLLLDHWGTASVAATALLGVACALALWWLKPPPHPPA